MRDIRGDLEERANIIQGLVAVFLGVVVYQAR